MSTFKTSWIIIKKNIIKDKESSVIIFTKDYGKIVSLYKNNKKEKQIDVWNIINFEITTKTKNINTLKNILILNQLNYNNYNYNIILEYLNIINIIFKLIPLNQAIFWVYDIVYEINKYTNISEEKLLLAQIKLLSILWYIKEENKSLIIKKILNFIQTNNIKEILKLKWLDENSLNKLKEIVINTINNK